jgi:hypothetical protein
MTINTKQRSLWGLVKIQPALREASLIQAMLFGAFSIFWSTLAFLLTPPTGNFRIINSYAQDNERYRVYLGVQCI